MKALFGGLVTAFSMYSIIPMPQIEWNKNTMKYALACFPLVGGVTGAAAYFLNLLLFKLSVSPLLYAVIMTACPIIISGAIHLDGFIDTCDARYSRQETEKKLQILKDPHVGAFGVISAVVFLLLYCGVFAQFFEKPQNILLISLSYFISRCFSGISIVSFKLAKNTGLAYIFSDNADKKKVRTALIIELVLAFAAVLFVNLYTGAAMLVLMTVWFLLYRRMSYKEFGGITGDLAGYFLVISEFLGLAAATVGAYVC